MEQLVEIRHSKVVTKKKNNVPYDEHCNALCVRVAAGSKGEAYCPKCNEHFNFEVFKNSDNINDLLKNIHIPSHP